MEVEFAGELFEPRIKFIIHVWENGIVRLIFDSLSTGIGAEASCFDCSDPVGEFEASSKTDCGFAPRGTRL